MDFLYEWDLLNDALTAFHNWMIAGPSLTGLVLCLIFVTPLMVLIHELGHAVMAKRRLGGDVEIQVGSSGRLVDLRIKGISIAINAITNPTRILGEAVASAMEVTPRDVFMIAIAGPLASLASGAIAAILYLAAPDSGPIHDILWMAVMEGICGTLNLIPFRFQERRGGPDLSSDGWQALDAYRIARSLA